MPSVDALVMVELTLELAGMGRPSPVVAGVANTAPSILLVLFDEADGWEKLGVKEAAVGVVGTIVVAVVDEDAVAAVKVDQVLTGEVVGLLGGTMWMLGDTETRCAADAVAVAQSDGRGGGRASVALVLPLSMEPFLGLSVLLPPLPKTMLLVLLWRWWWNKDPTPEPPEPLAMDVEFVDADVEPRLRVKEGFLLRDGRRSLVKTLGRWRSLLVPVGSGGTAGSVGSGGGGIEGGSRCKRREVEDAEENEEKEDGGRAAREASPALVAGRGRACAEAVVAAGGGMLDGTLDG